MANLRDIYSKVGRDLFEQYFDHGTTEEKKEMVDVDLKVYLATKIAEENPEKAKMLSDRKDVSVEELVELLGDLIPKEEHFDTMRHLTHFMLNIAGEMQGWSITWWDEQDVEFVDNPLVQFNESGKWESLTTHRDTSYVKTFKFVYDIYKNTFMEKAPKNRQLTMIPKQLPKGDE